MFLHRPFTSLLLLLVPALACGATAHADSLEHEPDKRQELLLRDQMRDMVREGKLLPLSTLKARVLGKLPGELIDVRVDHEDGAILYEFRILRESGQVTEVEIDAASGRIIEIENE